MDFQNLLFVKTNRIEYLKEETMSIYKFEKCYKAAGMDRGDLSEGGKTIG